jgi:hypothetical protein
MISEIISRAACLAELTSNPKSFSNCSDLHGGVPGEEEQNAMFDQQRLDVATHRQGGVLIPTK